MSEHSADDCSDPLCPWKPHGPCGGCGKQCIDVHNFDCIARLTSERDDSMRLAGHAIKLRREETERANKAEAERDEARAKLAALREWAKQACVDVGCVGDDEMGCLRDDDCKPPDDWCPMCALSNVLKHMDDAGTR
jgi:hypothetical protein